MRYIALWRGINVGKAKRLAMADLKALLTELGATDVKTLLNSGNAVFDTKTAADPVVKELLALGCDSRIDVVHLVMQALPGEDSWRDIDFSDERLRARWSAGLKDGRRMLARAPWKAPARDHVGMRVHTLDGAD